MPADVAEAARAHLREAGWDGHLGERSRHRWSPREFAAGVAVTFGLSAALITLAVLRPP